MHGILSAQNPDRYKSLQVVAVGISVFSLLKPDYHITLCPSLFSARRWDVELLSHVQVYANPWPIQSMEFSRPEYWSG